MAEAGLSEDEAYRRLRKLAMDRGKRLNEIAARGEVKALWIACSNPAQSMPDQALVRAALERCELVVLQEAFGHTATARYADVLLPGATWAEKKGTVTNSERRISRVRAAVAPPGAARDDWRIVVDFARLLESRLRPGTPSLFPYESIESIWNEHRETTRGRDAARARAAQSAGLQLLRHRGAPNPRLPGPARRSGAGAPGHPPGRTAVRHPVRLVPSGPAPAGA